MAYFKDSLPWKVAVSFAMAPYIVSAAALPPGDMPYGAFDPAGDYSDESEVLIEHVFLPWEDVSLISLLDADEYTLERSRALMVTIEPWTWTVDERNTPEFLKNGILSGYYDANMRGICKILNDLQSPISVRWGHEMERTTGQFIWSDWEPEDYITAYKRMIDICRAEAPDINIVWSPAGDQGLERYYPGDDYVDVVGLSIFGLESWETEILGGPRTYDQWLSETYARASTFGKPVIVAELGFVGSADYVQSWRNAVRQPQPDKPLLSGVVYFNQKEVYPWPDGYGLPDWRLESQILN
ncbi:glycoside hydrolase family 26 protein [uncultured Litoreibacter sp.]|uniref:glycoside hydrolase family 26 protein n=1 Tax=uncultured Litoreibacter sp. TaxID=1392394 RepID=UPI002608BB73|nr:glycosyl hydrolase [uncultured Litoreibacter sp.]